MPDLCFHCLGPVTDTPSQAKDRDGSVKNFCCKACLSIWELITEGELDQFYTYREKKRPRKPENFSADFSQYDAEALSSQFVETKDGLSETSFLLNGISCTACVWLTEKVIMNLEGVRHTKVLFSNGLATVRWETQKVPLSTILSTFRKYGFDARPYTPSAELTTLSKNNNTLLFRLGVAGFAAGNIMLFYIAIYAGLFSGMEERIKLLFEWFSLVLATPALFFSASPLTRSMLVSLGQRRVNMDFPIVLALYTTYIYSAFALFNNFDPYFDTLSLFLFLILLGRYIQGTMKLKSLSISDSLKQLQMRSARIMKDTGKTAFKPVSEVAPGTIVQVQRGETLPLDGVIHCNTTVTVDESMITGESTPVLKERGCVVLGGTSLVTGKLLYRTTKTAGQNRIDEIVALLSTEDDTFSGVMTLSERVASWFTVCVLALATATYLFWFLKGHESPLLTALAVLIVTCPCAFGLAIPMAQIVSNQTAFSAGIVVKSFDSYEQFSNTHHIVFDKTGTLTYGRIEVEKIELLDTSFSEEEVLGLISPLEEESTHPVAYAIVKKQKEAESTKASSVKNVPGMGVSGIVNGMRVAAGNKKMFSIENISIPPEFLTEHPGGSVIFCAVEKKVVGKILLSDTLKPNLQELSDYFHSKKISLSILTGDSEKEAKRAGEKFRVQNVEAEYLPEDKMSFVEKAKGAAGTVVMVGDGVNDTPAFSKADLSVACNTSLDGPLEVADIVLLHDNILSLKFLHKLSLRCMGTIKQNLAISVSYNLIALPLAMSGHISPILAAILMPISSFTVLLNTKRILRKKIT
ncbi:MAG: heavy metal translocating P-type ATPase [Nitrospinota bacterium]